MKLAFRAHKYIGIFRNIALLDKSIEHFNGQNLFRLNYPSRCFGTRNTESDRIDQNIAVRNVEQTGMTSNDWIKRWGNNTKTIRWQLTDVHPFLKKYAPPSTTNTRVLVPLAGKSIDLIWLVDKGFQVCLF